MNRGQLTIDCLAITLPADSPAEPEPIHIQLSGSSIQMWTAKICGAFYHFQADPPFGESIMNMPHIDAVFRFLTDQKSVHRGSPIGKFLEPALMAMEIVIAGRDGSCVYFAQAGDQIKIGWSRKVAARLAKLQTGNGSPITLLGTIPGGRALERRIHNHFSGLRLAGEWFYATPDLLDFIAREAS